MLLLDLNYWAFFSIVTVTVLAFASVSSWVRQRFSIPTMVGPMGWPWIGVGMSLPSDYATSLRRWAQQYGEVFKLRLGWYDWVIVNSPEAVREIFDVQSVKTSSKGPLPYGHDIVSKGLRIFTMPYGSQWRLHRTMQHKLLNKQIAPLLVPSQEYEVTQLLYDLLSNNADQRSFYNHVKRMSMSITNVNSFGRRISSIDHPDFVNAGKSIRLYGKITRAGAFIEDDIPPLLWLPRWLQPSRRTAESYAQLILNDHLTNWNRVLAAIASETCPPCLGKDIAESDYRSLGITDAEAAWIIGGMVSASGTTATTILNAISYLAAFPDVQAVVHAEIAKFITVDRAPAATDLSRLPYVKAIVKEVLRLKPLPAFGIKHYADQETIYRQYRIPAGTILLANTISLHYDENRFEKPYQFHPARYLGYHKSSAEYATSRDPKDRDHYAFGVGRRICPAIRFAETTLELTIASILWAFEIRPPLVKDSDSSVLREGIMDTSPSAYEPSAFGAPKPYGVRFLPRHPQATRTIQSGWTSAQTQGFMLRGFRYRDADSKV